MHRSVDFRSSSAAGFVASRLLRRAGLLLGVLFPLLPGGLRARRASAAGNPRIAITKVPPAGSGETSQGTIAGTVSGSYPRDARVVIYSFTNTGYVQPRADAPFTPIVRSRWTNRIHLGFLYGALLVTKDYQPAATLPALPAVGGGVLAVTSADPHRVIRFSGLDWIVKVSGGPVGPGPNVFSDSSSNVAVDPSGRLHLRITQRNSVWQCAEVWSKRSLGYGTYRFQLDSRVGALDPSVVLGLFTWSDDPAFNHRELDVEFSRWSDPQNENAQYVLQPYDVPGNLHRFQLLPTLAPTTHQFVWHSDQAAFRSVRGRNVDGTDGSNLIQEHTFTQGIPQAGGESAHLNLWLFNGQPPTDGRPVEVIIRRFQFIPAA